jgi:two-component system chemotaxis sensor kinase CheA
VIKTLGKMYGDADGLTGATILGDGTVALILDVAGVIRTMTSAAPPQS